MCRVIAYLGRPILLDDLLYGPDSSLVAQVYDAELYAYLNLGGFGLAAWDAGFPDPEAPLHYRTPSLPTFDRNLRSLARKLTAGAVVAHVRGVPYDETESLTVHNVHPFRFDGTPVVLGMNGTLSRFGEMRYDLLGHIRPEIAHRIEGTTDSEWVYALLISQLSDPAAPATPEQLERATETALQILRETRDQHGVDTSSEMNLVVADGRTIVATRFAYDYGWYPEDETYYSKRRRYDFTSLWCTAGRDYVCRDGEWIMRGWRAPRVGARRLRADHQGFLDLGGGSRVRHDDGLAPRRDGGDHSARAGGVSAATPDRLATLPLFAGLAPDELSDLARAAQPFQRLPGERLFRQGEPADSLYVVESGMWRALRACRLNASFRWRRSDPAK